MLAKEVNVRDPFVLPWGGKYYLYGTRSATCWGPAEGFDCYVSEDLEHWDGPVEVFRREPDFWAVQNYWAPECYFYKGEFCLITTLGDARGQKSVNLLKSDSPLGPFRYVSRLTDPAEYAIDGTLWFEGEEPWLVYSRSFESGGMSEMRAVKLSHDLAEAVEPPVTLFSPAEAPWARPFPWAKEEFGLDGPVYFTDGPGMYPMKNGKLAMIWSGWSDHGYAVGVALSPTGNISGPWEQQPELLFPRDGGHGMYFTRFDGTPVYVLHYPNDKEKEHPVFYRLEEQGDTLQLEAADGSV